MIKLNGQEAITQRIIPTEEVAFFIMLNDLIYKRLAELGIPSHIRNKLCPEHDYMKYYPGIHSRFTPETLRRRNTRDMY